MIKLEKCVEFLQSYVLQDAQGITLENIEQAITSKCTEYQIPIVTGYDTIKAGGLFSSTKDDCLLIMNDTHKYNYYIIVVTFMFQGIMGYAHFYLTGHSKQFDKLAYKQEIQAKYQNRKMSERIGASIGSAPFTMGINKGKMQEEQSYYDAIKQIIRLCFE